MKNSSFAKKQLLTFLLLGLLALIGYFFYSKLQPVQTSTNEPTSTSNVKIEQAAANIFATAPEPTVTATAILTGTYEETNLQPISPISPVAIPETPTQVVSSPPVEIQLYTFEIVNQYPHDPSAFTQGLIYHNDRLYEGTGLNGRSSLRKVDLESGKVLEQVNLTPDYFGEGITLFNDRIIQLTWQNRRGFIWGIDQDFTPIKEYSYPTEGWGITHDGTQLIMSDGSDNLYFWDAAIMNNDASEPTVLKTLPVRANGEPVVRLNELEYINGKVFANIWQTDQVAEIDPNTGNVTGWIDLTGLLSPQERANSDVLNGIAYDVEHDRLFVTGKLWPTLFEIKLIPVDSSR